MTVTIRWTPSISTIPSPFRSFHISLSSCSIHHSSIVRIFPLNKKFNIKLLPSPSYISVWVTEKRKQFLTKNLPLGKWIKNSKGYTANKGKDALLLINKWREQGENMILGGRILGLSFSVKRLKCLGLSRFLPPLHFPATVTRQFQKFSSQLRLTYETSIKNRIKEESN